MPQRPLLGAPPVDFRLWSDRWLKSAAEMRTIAGIVSALTAIPCRSRKTSRHHYQRLEGCASDPPGAGRPAFDLLKRPRLGQQTELRRRRFSRGHEFRERGIR